MFRRGTVDTDPQVFWYYGDDWIANYRQFARDKGFSMTTKLGNDVYGSLEWPVQTDDSTAAQPLGWYTPLVLIVRTMQTSELKDLVAGFDAFATRQHSNRRLQFPEDQGGSSATLSMEPEAGQYFTKVVGHRVDSSAYRSVMQDNLICDEALCACLALCCENMGCCYGQKDFVHHIDNGVIVYSSDFEYYLRHRCVSPLDWSLKDVLSTMTMCCTPTQECAGSEEADRACLVV